MQSKGERRLGSERRSSHDGWQRWWVGWATMTLKGKRSAGGGAAVIDEGLWQQRKLCFCNRCKEGLRQPAAAATTQGGGGRHDGGLGQRRRCKLEEGTPIEF
ncbi:hypothetical protein C4D60_Mb05t16480 [Musa balbisiana]|uniref:Uncharacterized protein n=1 Tax=Musa balbisiana TaxID=52838 RepID=A0A4S8JWL3_MUSBA|nr:hypothetical protein C4D60_Mb05t16480 [Musa balbisiana]